MEDKKKINNLISIAILLAGLFAGSLFVDVAQLVRGSGFSERNLSKNDILESNGKTWVAYSEPKVNVKVLSDSTCEKCDPAEALVWFRRVVPTINAQKIDYNSDEGKSLAKNFSIKTLPAFVFADAIAKTDFYSQAEVLFEQKDGQYVLKTQELGLVPGKYVETPEINEGDAILGNKDSNVRVVVFSEFQCPYCKIIWSTMRDIMNQYGDKVLFDFKNLPLPLHPAANGAALAAECALEQGKYWEYGDKLFEAQSEWSADKGKSSVPAEGQKFKEYAVKLGLDASKFNQCLDGKKYQEKIDKDKNEATNLGISGTPATFINGQFKNGVASAEDIKAAIDQELSK